MFEIFINIRIIFTDGIHCRELNDDDTIINVTFLHRSGRVQIFNNLKINGTIVYRHRYFTGITVRGVKWHFVVIIFFSSFSNLPNTINVDVHIYIDYHTYASFIVNSYDQVCW